MDPVLTRRGLIIGGGLCAAAVCGLSACSSYGPEQEPAGSATAPAQKVQATKSEIPVGSGKIFTDANVVITQPTAGQFKGFTAICTHMQCVVQDVTDTINCICHGSKFSISDGSVVHPPATQPLQSYPVTVSGNQLTVG
jgi:nitrite reductase/ring-hydroxylating ferredoxin subunit